jgi:hypothetical protein
VKASVLCPGLIATRIFESGRNRPGGANPEPEAGSQEAAMREMIRNVFASGMPPAEVAGMVVAAIRNERFYILTHDHFEELIKKRTEAILARTAPDLVGPGLSRQQPGDGRAAGS